jgi:enamine deaminase RidA (YjgF/YER057c/UK114 family)
MAEIEKRLAALGLVLPPSLKPPAGVILPFRMVRVRGSRAIVSGHGPQAPDGSIPEPLGKVGQELTIEQGYAAARLTALSMLGSLKRELGDLDRIAAFSDLILELFGPEAGAHARSAVGMAALPFRIPVEIEAEVEIRP